MTKGEGRGMKGRKDYRMKKSAKQSENVMIDIP